MWPKAPNNPSKLAGMMSMSTGASVDGDLPRYSGLSTTEESAKDVT